MKFGDISQININYIAIPMLVVTYFILFALKNEDL